MEVLRNDTDRRGNAEAGTGPGDSAIKILGGALSSKPAKSYEESNPELPKNVTGNRYLLQNWLCAGRLGDVYEAVDQQLLNAGQDDHRVIIELYNLPPGQSDLGKQFASRFVDLLSVSHPNIARIIDFGIDGTTVFFTTELLYGASLRAVLDHSSTDTFTENEVLGILAGITNALRCAHEKGIVHGDLKPESIFITDNYEIKIADLASAYLKQIPDSAAAAQNGNPVSSKPVDDVFGLGAVAYEMLSNEHPFHGARRHQAQRRGLELRRIDGIAKNRWKAISYALSLQPGARTPSLDEFATQFGIAGTESMREVEAHVREKPRWLLLSLFVLVTFVGAIALIQSNDIKLADVVSDIQDRTGLLLDTNSSPGISAAESSSATANLEPRQNENPVPEETAQIRQAAETADSQPAVVDDGGTVPSRPRVDSAAVQLPQAEVTPSDPPFILDEQAVVAASGSLPESPVSENDVAGTEPPPSISFAQEVLTTYEKSGMAAISIRRQGAIGDEVSLIWWTADNTAIANQDYADLGARTEKLRAGQTSVTIYVPLIVDSRREPTESFYVFAGLASAPKHLFDRLEVLVIDSQD